MSRHHSIGRLLDNVARLSLLHAEPVIRSGTLNAHRIGLTSALPRPGGRPPQSDLCASRTARSTTRSWYPREIIRKVLEYGEFPG